MLTRLRSYINALYYPWLTYWCSDRPTQDVLATIDRDEFKKLLKYKFKVHDLHYQKYFNIDYWMRLNVVRAMALDLHRRKNLSILDIGSGFGYFPYAARFYHHQVVGADLPGDELFEKVCDFLELDIRALEIKPLTPLPDFGTKFDLVTAFQVCFHGHRSENLWGVKEWKFFLDDLFSNHVNDGGRMYMDLNYEPALGQWLPDDVIALFKNEYGARFRGYSRVTLYKP